MTKSIAYGALLAAGLFVGGAVEGQVGKNGGVLDPNLAGEKQLLALAGLDSALVEGLVARRPFVGMGRLHAYLDSALDAGALKGLYTKLFAPINLNAASEAEILLVPGVGKRLAHEFGEYRPYRHLAQFRRQIGKYVDEGEVARLEQYVFVPIGLNTASDADILSIPGVGKRLLHEFKEYRPYENLAQFRRQIGKYVDDGELARLEGFVVLEKGD